MPRHFAKRVSLVLATLAVATIPAIAMAAASEQPVSGNGWIALGVIGLLIGVVVMLVRGTLFIEHRHARMHGPSRGHHHGWFGAIDSDDDDDSN